jgi:hypothetical protein
MWGCDWPARYVADYLNLGGLVHGDRRFPLIPLGFALAGPVQPVVIGETYAQD